MNIASASIAAFYLSTVAVMGNFAVDFIKDSSNMNASVIKSLRAGDMSLQGSRAQINKVCVNSSVFLSTQGYGGVKCDTANATVKF